MGTQEYQRSPDFEGRVEDREALRELRAKYTHYWDDGHAEQFIGLFTADAVFQMGPSGFVRGADALRQGVLANIGRSEFGIHFTTDEITEFTGPDTAKGICRFAFHGGRTPNIQGAGSYHDEYRRTPEGWRFTSRRITFYYFGQREGEWPTRPEVVEEDFAVD
jgi:hypothetical protein